MANRKTQAGSIHVGIGGWNYDPWRETFYPKEVKKKDELAYASTQVTAIEINATYYRTQSESSFARWRDETPDGFVFSVKASRFATNRKVLADGADSIGYFVDSGLASLGDKLGPLLWQFMPTKKFDAGRLRRVSSRCCRRRPAAARCGMRSTSGTRAFVARRSSSSRVGTTSRSSAATPTTIR